KGFADQLAKIAPDLKIVASLPGDWDRQKAANIANDTMTANPELVGIFCANDTMALGAVESVYAAGKGGQIVVIGVDGNTDAVKSIKAGRLTASVAQLPYLVGKQAVEKAKEVLAGKSVDEFTYVQTLVLTKKLMDQGTHPALQYLKYCNRLWLRRFAPAERSPVFRRAGNGSTRILHPPRGPRAGPPSPAPPFRPPCI